MSDCQRTNAHVSHTSHRRHVPPSPAQLSDHHPSLVGLLSLDFSLGAFLLSFLKRFGMK